MGWLLTGVGTRVPRAFVGWAPIPRVPKALIQTWVLVSLELVHTSHGLGTSRKTPVECDCCRQLPEALADLMGLFLSGGVFYCGLQSVADKIMYVSSRSRQIS